MIKYNFSMIILHIRVRWTSFSICVWPTDSYQFWSDNNARSSITRSHYFPSFQWHCDNILVGEIPRPTCPREWRSHLPLWVDPVPRKYWEHTNTPVFPLDTTNWRRHGHMAVRVNSTCSVIRHPYHVINIWNHCSIVDVKVTVLLRLWPTRVSM